VKYKIIPLQLKDTFRSQLNPLRGLTPSLVVNHLENGQRGIYPDLQWLYRFIEKRDATLRACKRKLLGRLGGFEWCIKIIDQLPEGKDRIAEEQKEFLRQSYERIDNLKEAIKHLGMADFRGYAHLEPHWRKDGDRFEIHHLEPVPQWHWIKDGLYGDWKFVEDATSSDLRGEEVDAESFLIREIDDPVNEIALVAFVRKQLSQKDWDGFIENFGIPYTFLILPENAGTEDQDEFQATVEDIAAASRGVLPFGTKIETADIKTVGDPFKKHLDYQDDQIVLSVTGSLLTMLAKSGSGTLAGNAHEETFDSIGKALAKAVAETFQEQFDKRLLANRWPEEEVYAYFDFETEDEEEVGEIIDHAVKLKQAGYAMEAEELSERTGYNISLQQLEKNESQSVRDSREDGSQPSSPIKNRASSHKVIKNRATNAELGQPSGFLEEAREQNLRALADALAPFRRVLETTDDPDQIEYEWSELLAKPETLTPYGDVLTGIMASAMVNGAERGNAQIRDLRGGSPSGAVDIPVEFKNANAEN